MLSGFQPTGIRKIETDTLRRLKAQRAEHYLYGFRIDDIRTAAKMGGHCVTLFHLIHFRRLVTKSEQVTLPNGFLAEFGIDKSAKQRALKLLEAAKLITVKRILGHSAVVQLTARAKKRSA
jgi:hypothetical protein